MGPRSSHRFGSFHKSGAQIFERSEAEDSGRLESMPAHLARIISEVGVAR